MREIVTAITSTGQVTVPAEVRRLLGIATPGKVVFVIDGPVVRLRRFRHTLQSVRGVVPPIPGTSADFEREIEEAKEAATGVE